MQRVAELQGGIDEATIVVGDFNPIFLVTDGTRDRYQ